MAEECTAKQMHDTLVKYLEGRRDLGFWKGLVDFVLEPQNPFEPEKRRGTKKGFCAGCSLGRPPAGRHCLFQLLGLRVANGDGKSRVDWSQRA